MQKKRVNIKRDVDSRRKIAQLRPRAPKERKTESVTEVKNELQKEAPSPSPDTSEISSAGDKTKKGGRKTAGDI